MSKEKKPLIPKRMASRIRTSQNRFLEAVEFLLIDEERERDRIEEIAEFERSPQRYADRRYPGHGVDSYPVQTRIKGARESLERNRARRQAAVQRIHDAAAAMEATEASVMEELAKLRPGTPGRVAWPKAPPRMESLRKSFEKEQREANEKAQRDLARQRAMEERADEREERKLAARMRMEDEKMMKEWQRELSALSPEEREARVNAMSDLADGLERGDFSVHDLIAHLQSQS